MLVLVLLALGGAGIAGAGAKLENLSHDLTVFPGLPQADVRRGVADVRAIEAQADALVHVHTLCDAGVGAAAAHLRAVAAVIE